jgi:hypothetical protein
MCARLPGNYLSLEMPPEGIFPGCQLISSSTRSRQVSEALSKRSQNFLVGCTVGARLQMKRILARNVKGENFFRIRMKRNFAILRVLSRILNGTRVNKTKQRCSHGKIASVSIQ